MAQYDLGKVSIRSRGIYSTSALYEYLDIVIHEGSTYMYINSIPSKGNSLTNTDYWQSIAPNAGGGLQKIYTPPPGEIMLFAGDVVPDGWLPCAGALVSRTAYPELFAVLGTVYGAGDGSTTFALPDTADRFPRFAGTLDVGMTQEDAIRNIYGRCGALYRSATLGSEGAMLLTQYGPTPAAQGTAGAIIGDNVLITIDASLFVPTAAENRPKAIALKACIKY